MAEKKRAPLKLLVAATTGGHLTEAMSLLGGMADAEFVILTEKTARMPDKKVYFYGTIRTKSIMMVVQSFFVGLWVILKERPNWVITTGAEVGLGAVLAAKLLGRKTIFIETVTRYKNATSAGKLCYPLVNKFYVQHDASRSLFGKKAEYIGGLM